MNIYERKPQNNPVGQSRIKQYNNIATESHIHMKILYDGIGCNTTHEHTEAEFLAIMNREFTHKCWKSELARIPREQHYQLQFKDWVLPDDFVFFTLSDWIEYSGAMIET